MNQLINNIVERQKIDKVEIVKSAWIPREAAANLKASLQHRLIKAVIGPRRSGKSSLVHKVLTQNNIDYAYLNFEDEQIPEGLDFELFENALEKVYPNSTLYFFDEIQTYPRWEQLLNRLDRSGKRMVISGSNSKLLGSELASSLTGRHEVIEVLPFSYGEYKSAQQESIGDAELLRKYLKSGGFPDIVMSRANQVNYLRELWDSIILKDIVQRFRIRNVTGLKALFSIFRDSISARFSNRSLERALYNRISIATIGKFLSYGQGAYLTFTLENFSFKSRQRIASDKKAYLIDSGFFTCMKIGAQDDYGRLLENLIFIEILRRGLKPNLDFFYYQTSSGKEVDFVILENGRPAELIQVAWVLNSQKTLERELSSLEDAAKELGITKLKIITAEQKAVHTFANFKVEVIPFIDYFTKAALYFH